MCSVNAKSLNSERSKFTRPGPYSALRAALPNRPLGGWAKAVASNHRDRERSLEERTPLPMRSGRLPPAPFVLADLLRPGLKGRPLCAIALALSRQPPRTV